MKKIIPLLFVLSLLSSSIFAASQFTPASGTNIEWSDYSYKITPDTGLVDTLAGTSDSITIWTLKQFEPGWHYVAKSGIITGGGSDSVKFIYAVDVYNSSKVRIGRYFSTDTVTTYTGSTIELPIFTQVMGSYYTIKAMSVTDNGGVVILNNLYIDRFRYKTIDK